MLVLTRKQNEKIRIGSSIVITVVRMKGKAVRLGIEAPSDVNILRGELVFETTAEDHSQAPPLRNKTKPSIPVSHRNPNSNWSGEQREEQAKSNPKAILDPRLDRLPSELVGSFMI